MVVHSTDPRAVRRQTIGRGLIALVWALGDVGQVALAWSGGIGDRPGDAPLVAFAVSAAIGAVLLCGLVAVNLLAVKAIADRTRQARLLNQARLISWLCGLRLVVVLATMFAVRGSTGPDAPVTELTFQSLVIFAFVDAAVALGIAAGTMGGLRRVARLGPSTP
jgi:hypothetical protein